MKKLLQTKENMQLLKIKLKKLDIFDSIYFRDKSHFEDDGNQNCLVFQTAYRYFKTVTNNDANILSWKFKAQSDESIKPPSKSNKMPNPSLNYVGTKARLKFNGDCLKQKKLHSIMEKQ